jgi:hypothetical protein
MKLKKNWWLWLLIFICFVVVWMSRSAMIEYRLHTKNLEIEMKHAPAPDISGKSIPAPVPQPVRESVDIWGWIIKGCAGLSGLKTLLDILDRFKSKRVKS